MEFPLTTAVLPVLYLRVPHDVYALPIPAIDSLTDIEEHRIHRFAAESRRRSAEKCSGGDSFVSIRFRQRIPFAKRVGADGFVAKFVPDELVREIAKALSPLPVRYGWFHYPSACRGDIN